MFATIFTSWGFTAFGEALGTPFGEGSCEISMLDLWEFKLSCKVVSLGLPEMVLLIAWLMASIRTWLRSVLLLLFLDWLDRWFSIVKQLSLDLVPTEPADLDSEIDVPLSVSIFSILNLLPLFYSSFTGAKFELTILKLSSYSEVCFWIASDSLS